MDNIPLAMTYQRDYSFLLTKFMFFIFGMLGAGLDATVLYRLVMNSGSKGGLPEIVMLLVGSIFLILSIAVMNKD
ncbi:MAG: hypothetical protein ABEI53_00415 [Candidatus Magasanikbacteria bacterium]